MAIAFDANLGTVTNSATLTTSAPAASASRVVMTVFWFDVGGATCTGATGGGLTWVADHQGGDGSNNIAFVSADAPSGLPSSSGITPTFSSAVDFGPGMAAASFTGVATGASGYVDTTAAWSLANTQDWDTLNLTTTMADTLLFGASWTDGTSHTADTNYTELHDWLPEGSNRVAVVYRIVSSAGTYNPGGLWNAGISVEADIGIAYEAGAAEPPPAAPDLYVTRSVVRWR